MSIRGYQADSSHELDSLEHDQGDRGGDGPSQECQGLLVVEEVSEPHLIVHNRLQTFYAFQLDSIPFRITKIA